MPQDLKVYFNFRSPYCFLAAQTMFDLFERFNVTLQWRPLGGWDGRSPPERAAVKIPSVRQDVARWARRLGVSYAPPPPTTDPTLAALASFVAEEKGLLRPYVIEVMKAEWSEGQDIGNAEVLIQAAARAGLDEADVRAAFDNADYQARLARHAEEAKGEKVFGVPSFVVSEEIFWGNDRLDFLGEHLTELGLAKS